MVDKVIWRGDDGQIHRHKLRFLTIEIKDGGEYLVAADQDGIPFHIRLDRIESMPPGHQKA
nr:hypothetical protein [Amphritea japonica]